MTLPTTIGHYTATLVSRHDGVDLVEYVGPGGRPVRRFAHARVDVIDTLHDLNDAYDRGREDAQRDMRAALGVRG